MTTDAMKHDALTASARRTSRGEAALSWWRRLTDDRNGDPGAIARLRRARSSAEVIPVRAGIVLARRLGASNSGALDDHVRATLDLARVLSHVREHVPDMPPMRAAGWKHFAGDRKETDAGDDRPALSEARFRRLLETGDGEEKVAAFTRLVALMDGKACVDALANDFLYWNHPEYGDKVRERWAFQYYAAGDAAPKQTTPDTEDASE